MCKAAWVIQQPEEAEKIHGEAAEMNLVLAVVTSRTLLDAYAEIARTRGLPTWQDLGQDQQERAIAHVQGNLNSILRHADRAVRETLEMLAPAGGFQADG